MAGGSDIFRALMQFDSFTFLLFFALVLLGAALCRTWSTRKSFLLLASYLFYALWDGYGGECSKRWCDMIGAPREDGRKVLNQEAPYEDLREWVLPYEAVRSAPDPDHALLEFLQSTYEAAADLGKWDRAALERPSGWQPPPSAAQSVN